MKRILLALTVLVGLFVSASFFTAPAANATVSCGAQQTRYGVTYELYNHPTIPSPDLLNITAEAKWRACTDTNGPDFVKVDKFRVGYYQHGLCNGGSGSYRLNQINFNPDSINWWDPSSDSINCLNSDDGSFVYSTWQVPSGGFVNVFPSTSDRCISTPATAYYNGPTGIVGDSFNIPAICWLP